MPTEILGPDGAPVLHKNVIKVYRTQIDIKSAERTVLAAVSTDAIDRDGEVVVPRGIDKKHFSKNPVVLWAHDYRQMPIGKSVWTKTTSDGKRFLALTRFNSSPMGEAIFRLYQSEDLNAFSIGFQVLDYSRPTERELQERPELEACNFMLRKTQLLEYSAVPVPANPEALALEISKADNPTEAIIRQAVLDHKRFTDTMPVSLSVPITLVASDHAEKTDADKHAEPEAIVPAEDHDEPVVEVKPAEIITPEPIDQTKFEALDKAFDDTNVKTHLEDMVRCLKELKKGFDDHRVYHENCMKSVKADVEDLRSKHAALKDALDHVSHLIDPATTDTNNDHIQQGSPDSKGAEKLHAEDVGRHLQDIRDNLDTHKQHTDKCYKELCEKCDGMCSAHQDLCDKVDRIGSQEHIVPNTNDNGSYNMDPGGSRSNSVEPPVRPFMTREDAQKSLIEKFSPEALLAKANELVTTKVATLQGRVIT